MGYTHIVVRHLIDERPRGPGSRARLREVRQALGGA